MRFCSPCVLKMNKSRWALFFVFLFGSDYVVTATASLVRQKRSSGGCKPNNKMEVLVDECFDDVKNEMDDEYSLGDRVSGNLQLLKGQATGVRNFKRRGELRCECSNDALRFFIELSFLDITVTFVVRLLDGVLGGLLGNLSNALVSLLGRVVNLVIGLLALEIKVSIVVEQKLEPGSKCQVVDYKVDRISGIRVLNVDLTSTVVGLVGQVLNPLVESLLTNLLDKQVRNIIARRIAAMTITPDMYSCQ